jgi:hypothetical protein
MGRRPATALFACACALVAPPCGAHDPPAALADSTFTLRRGPGTLTLSGYLEAFYSWNFNAPANGITNLRAFDSLHDSMTVANAVLQTDWSIGPAYGRVAIQFGHTAETFDLGEPAHPGSASVPRSDALVWRNVQQLTAGARLPWPARSTFEAGVFFSPIGPEVVPTRENWNWSRSNLFALLPFYHSGARLNLAPGRHTTLTAAVYNGWNNVVDNNDSKSLALTVLHEVPDLLTLSATYFGGNERPVGAPEGPAWRNTLDLWVLWQAARRVSLMAHGDVGLEVNRLGTSRWIAGALYARVQLAAWLHLALRLDAFNESAARDGARSAARIFLPVAWVSSQTLTLHAHPSPHLSFWCDLRHDEASGDAFFAGAVMGDGAATPYLPNARRQTTLTLGMIAGF